MSDPTDEACRAVYEERDRADDDVITVLKQTYQILGIDDTYHLADEQRAYLRLRELRKFIATPPCESITEHARRYVHDRGAGIPLSDAFAAWLIKCGKESGGYKPDDRPIFNDMNAKDDE